MLVMFYINTCSLVLINRHSKKKKEKKTHLSEARDASVSSPLFKPTAAVAGASAVSKGGGIWTCCGYDMAVSFIFEVVKVIVKTNI